HNMYIVAQSVDNYTKSDRFSKLIV
ncbi:hypothetical protein LCGC14_0978460, partial [marine sediment metagenome]